MPFQFTLSPHNLPYFTNALTELIAMQACAGVAEPTFKVNAFKELYNNIIACLQTIVDPQILNLLCENLAIFIVKLEADKQVALQKIAHATQQISMVTQLQQITQNDVSNYNSFQNQIQQLQHEINQYIKATELTNGIIDLLKKQLSKELIANSPLVLYFRKQDFIMLKNCIDESTIALKELFSQFYEATVPSVVAPLSSQDKRRSFHKGEPNKLLKSAIRHQMRKSGTENRFTLLFLLSKERRKSLLLNNLSLTNIPPEGRSQSNDDDNSLEANTSQVLTRLAPSKLTEQIPLKPARAAPKPPVPALPPVRQLLFVPPAIPPLPPSSNGSTQSDLEILTQACQRSFVPQFISEILGTPGSDDAQESQDNELSFSARERLDF